MADFRAEWDELPPQKWIWDGILEKGGISLLGGIPKVGKSTFVRALAAAVAEGDDLLGKETRESGVMSLHLQESKRSVGRHFSRLGWPEGVRLISFDEGDRDGWLGNNDALRRTIEEHKPDLLIIDMLIQWCRLGDKTSDYGVVAERLAPIEAVARETDTHILLSHHAGKYGGTEGREFLGSTSFFGAVDVGLVLTRNDLGDRVLKVMGRDDINEKPIVVSYSAETGRVHAGQAGVEHFGRMAPLIVEVLKGEDGWMTAYAIAKKLGVEGNYTREVVPALESLAENHGSVEAKGVRGVKGTKGRQFRIKAAHQFDDEKLTYQQEIGL